MKQLNRYAKVLLPVALGALCLSGCSSQNEGTSREVVVDQQTYVVPDPGAVEFVWEPPLVDVVEVPPGLDPEGHYYRPSHQEVVEIRQGRWKYYKNQELDQ